MEMKKDERSCRRRIIDTITWKNNGRAPHHINFTQEMLDKMVAHTGNPQYVETLGNHIRIEFLTKPILEIRPGFFEDEFGVVWNRTGADKDIGVVDGNLIEDITKQDEYTFPPVDEAFVRGEMEKLAADDAGKFRLADLGFSMFERAWTLCGMENLMCWMVEEPEEVHRLMQRIHAWNMGLVRIAMEYDIDAICFGDDWGQQKGLIMGPPHWREFIKPYCAEAYAYVRDSGRYVFQHSCGDIREIMDELIEMGLQVYQTFQPEIYGLDYVKTLEGRLTIWGGISTQVDLPYRTPDEIRAVTRTTMAAFAKGGWIAAPTHDVPNDVPPENIEAMMEAIMQQ